MVELLAAIAILAVLVTVAGFFIASYISWTHQVADEQTLHVLNDALTRYKTQGGSVMALTSEVPIAHVLARLQSSITWAGMAHQVLQAGVTYRGASIYAKGTGAQYHFTSFGAYQAETGGTSPIVKMTYSDDFNRANQTLETSVNWIKQGNYPLTVSSNQVVQGSPIVGLGLYRYAGSAAADQYSQIDCINPAYNSIPGCAVRIPLSGIGGYVAEYTSAFTRYRIARCNADGTFTFLGQVSTTGLDPRGHTFKMTAVGNTISLYWDSSFLLSVTDSTWTTGGVGLGSPFGSPYGLNVDNFVGGDL